MIIKSQPFQHCEVIIGIRATLSLLWGCFTGRYQRVTANYDDTGQRIHGWYRCSDGVTIIVAERCKVHRDR